MKILVLQLARFGDILTTWPVLRALRRKHPTAEIHFLVRSRFVEATHGLSAVDRVWSLDVEHVLEPLLSEEVSVEGSVSRLDNLYGELSAQDFTDVINLSFSPASAFCRSLSHF